MTTRNNKIFIAFTCVLLVILGSYSQAKTCQELCDTGGTHLCSPSNCPTTGYTAKTDGDAWCGTNEGIGSKCCCPSASASGADSSGFAKASCSCTCNNIKQLNTTGIYKGNDQTIAKGKCQDQCARTCGGFTNCSDQTDAGCTTCCDTFCTTYYTKGGDGSSSKPGETVTDLCKTSCKSTCKFKGTINGITDIIYMIAGLLGALMIAVHGIRMVTSQDPHDRDAAKSSIMHVIIALIIIAMAAALVNMFISMGGVGT